MALAKLREIEVDCPLCTAVLPIPIRVELAGSDGAGVLQVDVIPDKAALVEHAEKCTEVAR